MVIVKTVCFKFQRAKKVFDPSDNNVPKRRVKSTKPANKKRNQDVKSKSQTTNELLSYSSTDTVSVSPTSIQLPHSLSIIPSEFIEEKPIVCFICSKTIHKKELVDCSICKIKGSNRPTNYNIYLYVCK